MRYRLYCLLFISLSIVIVSYAFDNNNAAQEFSLNTQDFGLSGPFSLATQYSRLLGLSLTAHYNSCLTQTNALALELAGGQNQYRLSGTFGQQLTPQQRIKLTLEHLAQNLNFDFDSGDISRWIHQNAAGMDYEYLLDNKWLHTLDFTLYYAKASSIDLHSRYYTSGDAEYENFRRIAGGTGMGMQLGGDLYFNRYMHLQTGLSYDQVNFDRINESNHHQSSLGQYINVEQILNPHLKFKLQEKTSALYHSFEGGFYWLLKTLPGSRLELGLQDTYITAQPGLPNDNQIMLNATYSFGGSWPDTSIFINFAPSTQQSLKSWNASPAVHMPYVLAMRDQRNVIRVATIYIAQVPSWAWHASEGAYYEFDLKTLILAPIDGGPLTINLIGALPDGLTYNQTTYILSGIPVALPKTATPPPAKSLIIDACNNTGCATPRRFSIILDSGIPYISPIPTEKQYAMIDKPYELDLKTYVPATLAGGSLKITLTGQLPNGLTFDEVNDEISGTPTTRTTNPGDLITIHASNDIGDAQPRTFNIMVQGHTPIIQNIPTELQQAFINHPYSLDLKNYVSGNSQDGSITISLEGTLPTGLSYNQSDEIISGTPTQVTNGTPSILIIHAHNNAGDATPQSFHILILDGKPIIAAIHTEKQQTFENQP